MSPNSISIQSGLHHTLGDNRQETQAGTWVHMPPGLKHPTKAKTPVVMLLVLLK
jgi:quercetin dioxygenase-like cupin family protein